MAVAVAERRREQPGSAELAERLRAARAELAEREEQLKADRGRLNEKKLELWQARKDVAMRGHTTPERDTLERVVEGATSGVKVVEAELEARRAEVARLTSEVQETEQRERLARRGPHQARHRVRRAWLILSAAATLNADEDERTGEAEASGDGLDYVTEVAGPRPLPANRHPFGGGMDPIGDLRRAFLVNTGVDTLGIELRDGWWKDRAILAQFEAIVREGGKR